MPETIPLCGCRVIEAERQADQLILKLACPIEQVPEAGGGEAGGESAHEQRTRLLRQAAEPLPAGEVLLQR